MLIIRSQQIDSMAEGRWADFERRLAIHVAEVLPAEATALGPGGLAAAIGRHVQAARSMGLDTERDVARYVDLFIALGAAPGGVPLDGWLGPILGDEDEAPGVRLSRAYGQLPARSPAHEGLAAWWAA